MARDVTIEKLCEFADQQVIHAPKFADGTDTARLNLVLRHAEFVSLESGSHIGLGEKLLISEKTFENMAEAEGCLDLFLKMNKEAKAVFRQKVLHNAVTLECKQEWPFKTGNTYRITFHGEPVRSSEPITPAEPLINCPTCGVDYQYDLEAKKPKGCYPGFCVTTETPGVRKVEG